MIVDVKNLVENNDAKRVYKAEKIEDLVESIKVHGVLNPICIDEEHVTVDGHRRVKACLKLGIEKIKYRIVENTIENVLILNQYRRKNYNDLLREGLEWEKIFSKLAKENQQKGGKGYPSEGQPFHTLVEVSKRIGISKDTFVKLKKINNENPGLILKIDNGEITIKEAFESIFPKKPNKENIIPLGNNIPSEDGKVKEESRTEREKKLTGNNVKQSNNYEKKKDKKDSNTEDDKNKESSDPVVVAVAADDDGGDGIGLEKTLHNMDALVGLKKLKNDSIDLICTSPPYDNMKEYGGDDWNLDIFKAIADELTRVLKPGGVIGWVVDDQVINRSRSCSSHRQLIYFHDKNKLKVHEEIIIDKRKFNYPSRNRYCNIKEYLFVYSKGVPKTFNPIKDRETRTKNVDLYKNKIRADGTEYKRKIEVGEHGIRTNIWRYNTGHTSITADSIKEIHPALMPEKLAEDIIISWSNAGDIVLDPFCGGGTTWKMAKLKNRKFIGFEIFDEYYHAACERVLGISEKYDSEQKTA